MVASYPISAARNYYRGSDPKKRQKTHDFNATAARIEKHVNELIAADPEALQSYLYYEIARSLDLPEETVRRALMRVDGGHNGLTVRKKGGIEPPSD